MLVRVPFLLVVGFDDYEVEANTLDEAREKIKEGNAQHVDQQFTEIKPNYSAIRDLSKGIES